MADAQLFVDLNWGLHHTNKQRKNGASNVTPRREPGRTAKDLPKKVKSEEF